MRLSYWEQKSWFSQIAFTIVGSGIVGLFCALFLRERYPEAKIIILEKGVLPQGASTKNAGFACFGSLSEIISDLKFHSKDEVLQLIKLRIEGLKLLRTTLGNKSINFKQYGGYELFLKSNLVLYNTCLDKQDEINKFLFPIFNTTIFSLKPNEFGFKNINSKCIFNAFEGQLDTGKLMQSLMFKVAKKGIIILNNTTLKTYVSNLNSVTIKTENFEFLTKKLFLTTNGFSCEVTKKVNVTPARAQVLITKPIKNLHIKGTFHLEEGYYYFRNINDRILLGGGRHLDFKTENTSQFGQTKIIQNKLKTLLKSTILPNTHFEIERQWSGIMGVGHQKKPIVKQLDNHMYCGVRLGGMGVAIGSMVGKKLAEML